MGGDGGPARPRRHDRRRPLTSAPAVTFVPKAPLVDVGRCPAAGATNPGTQADPLLDNLEEMAIGHGAGGGRRELFLISDDNFGAGQVTRVYELAIALGR